MTRPIDFYAPVFFHQQLSEPMSPNMWFSGGYHGGGRGKKCNVERRNRLPLKLEVVMWATTGWEAPPAPRCW